MYSREKGEKKKESREKKTQQVYAKERGVEAFLFTAAMPGVR